MAGMRRFQPGIEARFGLAALIAARLERAPTLTPALGMASPDLLPHRGRTLPAGLGAQLDAHLGQRRPLALRRITLLALVAPAPALAPALVPVEAEVTHRGFFVLPFQIQDRLLEIGARVLGRLAGGGRETGDDESGRAAEAAADDADGHGFFPGRLGWASRLPSFFGDAKPRLQRVCQPFRPRSKPCLKPFSAICAAVPAWRVERARHPAAGSAKPP